MAQTLLVQRARPAAVVAADTVVLVAVAEAIAALEAAEAVAVIAEEAVVDTAAVEAEDASVAKVALVGGLALAIAMCRAARCAHFV